ncbi:MAG: zinc ribbon domain-containing protein [Armatimonadetes bacterium]|nr:zinc ribbon domain-containing protein [Armatimonadota bacterium]
MPTYSYKCDNCEVTFDLLRPRSERDEAARCPVCGEKTNRRLMAAPNIRSRNSGGSTTSLSGDACSSCRSGSCATCARA